MEYCCKKLQRAVNDEVVIFGNPDTFWIRGTPRMVNDGDGYFDNMTDEIGISYCPFCGSQL